MRERFCQTYRAFVAMFQEASLKIKFGNVTAAIFPNGSFPPSLPFVRSGEEFDCQLDQRRGTDPNFVTCNPPTSVLVTPISTNSAGLFWQAAMDNTHYLIRYQPQGAQQWEFLQAPTESATLTGLISSTTYDVQIEAGCRDDQGDESSLSIWGSKVSFTTHDCPLCQ